MTAEAAQLCAFVEFSEASRTRVKLLVRVPLSAHTEVDAMCRRQGLHPLRFYRDAFDRGLRDALSEQAAEIAGF
jgi:hypothetical protein